METERREGGGGSKEMVKLEFKTSGDWILMMGIGEKSQKKIAGVKVRPDCREYARKGGLSRCAKLEERSLIPKGGGEPRFSPPPKINPTPPHKNQTTPPQKNNTM